MALKNLKQIYEESLIQAKYSSWVNIDDGKLFKWKGHIIRYVMGELKFRRIPYFGLTLADESSSIPCILVNLKNGVYKLLTSRCLTVLLVEPLLLAEIYSSPSVETGSVYILLDAERLQVTERNVQIPRSSLEEQARLLLYAENKNADNEWYQDFIPLKISSAISTFKSEIFCFVLVVLIDSGRLHSFDFKSIDNLVWLVLKNEHVFWKDLLLAYRIHTIAVPGEVPKNYFRSFDSLISIVNRNLDVSFYQMLHHRDLIKTNAALTVPKSCKMFTTKSNWNWTAVNIDVEEWCSVAAIKSSAEKFGSVFGAIKEIKYFRSWKSRECLWCEPSGSTNEIESVDCTNFFRKMSDLDVTLLDFYSKLRYESKNNRLWFPSTSFSTAANERLSGFGVKGGKWCLQILLEISNTGDSVYVYLRNWRLAQYPAGLIAGVNVCFTDLHAKRSKKNNIYLVGTPLTRVLHLNANVEENEVQCIDERFRFPNFTKNEESIWGVLYMDKLLYVSVYAKCKVCGNLLEAYCCPNFLCPINKEEICPEYEILANARILVETIERSVNVYLKDDHVREYLGLPRNMWRHLCKLSANSKFTYSHLISYPQPEDMDLEDIFFQLYCKYDRPRLRLQALCKPFRNEMNAYFCIELKESVDC